MGGDRTKMALGSSTWMGPSDRSHLLLLESKGPEEPEESQENLSSPGIAEVAVVFFGISTGPFSKPPTVAGMPR